MRESTLAVHLCEPKRRALAKNSTHVLIAYDAYNTFFRKTQHATRDKTYEEFSTSPFYNGFVKFGSFVHNISPLYPETFVNYLINNGIKLDEWCNESTYSKYVVALVKNETVETALERAIHHMLQWGTKNKTQWNQYLRQVSPNRGMYDIHDGKISPWIILNANTGHQLIKKMDDSQLATIQNILDIPFWEHTFRIRSDDTLLARRVIKDSTL